MKHVFLDAMELLRSESVVAVLQHRCEQVRESKADIKETISVELIEGVNGIGPKQAKLIKHMEQRHVRLALVFEAFFGDDSHGKCCDELLRFCALIEKSSPRLKDHLQARSDAV